MRFDVTVEHRTVILDETTVRTLLSLPEGRLVAVRIIEVASEQPTAAKQRTIEFELTIQTH
jgi:hypothetical protein